MERWRSLGVFVLVVTAIYLYAYPSATLVYAGAVLLHTGLGVLVSLALVVFLFRGEESARSGCWRAAVGFCLQRARLWAWR